MATSPRPPTSPSNPNALPPPFSSTTTALEPITQGAEALVYRTSFLSASTPCALKFRPPKPYRHPTLDRRLTRARVLAEARVLVRCRREGVPVPAVRAMDWEAGWVVLEWVEGMTVRRVLDGWVGRLEGEAGREVEAEGTNGTEGTEGTGLGEEMEIRRQRKAEGVEGVEELWDLMRRIGGAVGRMHEIGVVHGDLTTSNLMLRPRRRRRRRQQREGGGAAASVGEGASVNETTSTTSASTSTSVPAPPPTSSQADDAAPSLDGDVVLIDFGLAAQTVQDEERAVDLYVLERAFGATHPAAEGLFKEVLRAYGESYRGAKVALKRLEEVRARGRKKNMVG